MNFGGERGQLAEGLCVMVRSTAGEWGKLSNCHVYGGRCYWADSRQCWGWARCYHPPCLQQAVVELGPFHCPDCLREFEAAGVDEITLDQPVMHTMVYSLPPAYTSPDERRRCEKVACWFRWDGALLWLLGAEVDRRVVPICARAAIVAKTTQELGFPGGDHLYLLLK